MRALEKANLTLTARMWLRLLALVKGISLLATFFCIPVTIGFLVYYSFVCYDTPKSFSYALILYVLCICNLKIQGE